MLYITYAIIYLNAHNICAIHLANCKIYLSCNLMSIMSYVITTGYTFIHNIHYLITTLTLKHRSYNFPLNPSLLCTSESGFDMRRFCTSANNRFICAWASTSCRVEPDDETNWSPTPLWVTVTQWNNRWALTFNFEPSFLLLLKK